MANIQIYADLKNDKIFFDGSRVSSKEIGTLTAAEHPTQTSRVIIASNKQFKRNSNTEFRVFFKRLNINRIENKAGQQLTAAPLNYTRAQVIEYLTGQFETPIVNEYFEYNPVTDRLIARRDIEVQKNGFFLGGKHKMASGNSNIYFGDLDNGANSYPVFGEVLDQSIAANQLPGAGATKPKTRVFQDFQAIPLGGNPVNDTAIDYDGDNFFPFNISGVGITCRLGEAVTASQQLKYEIVVNGISVYVQYLTPGDLSINDDLTWYFEQPLDIEAGTTLRATVYKISIVDNQEVIDGILQVSEGDALPTRYHTSVLNRFFTDEPIALQSDVDALLSGSAYKGSYNGATALPALPTGTDVLGDFYRVTAAGGGYATGDILVYNGTDYDHIAEDNATASDIKNSGLKIHDIYVKANYLGAVQDGSVLYPYASIETALASAADGDSIYLEGTFEISGEIPLPADKSMFLYGSDDAVISYASYDASNASLLKFVGTDSTREFKFRNITFKNAGEYGLYITKAARIEIDDCVFTNNGWSGSGLNTILPSTTTALAGYDSDAATLQAFYAGAEASNGGAMRLEEITQVLITGNTVTKNLRGIRVQDCGVGGAGVVTRNQITQNIESGIYLAAGTTYGGSQNITVSMNVSGFNSNNGLLAIGGINNKFSQNEVNGNWNAGACFWGSANSTLRDCGLYDNNRSEFNGIGNTGDAKASIQINEAYNLLGTTISLNPDARFIAEILDTQVHYTGLGSNTEKTGVLITADVGALADDPKNIIKIDDVGFIGQDHCIDFCEVDLTNLTVSLGDNSFQSVGVEAVKQPLAGMYYELPFSNHTTNLNNADFSVDVTGNVVIKEGPLGSRLNPYSVNQLQAVAHGAEIRVILKESNRVQFSVPVSGCSIDGTLVNAVLNQAVAQLNSLFTNSTGFAAGGGNPVVSFVLSGDDLTLALDDGTSFTVDVTTLGVDENNFVGSGVISGNDLILTMTDSSTVIIDMTSMINGSSLSAINDRWYISYGTNANQPVNVTTMTAAVRDQGPYYFGQELTQGSEFKFNMNTGNQLRLGIWDGAEEATSYFGSTPQTDASNWNTVFSYANGTGKFTDSSNTDVSTYHPGGYLVASNAPMVIRFSADGHLTLLDVTGGTETIVAKTTLSLGVTSFNMQFGGFANSHFPNAIISSEDWTIVHDFDSSELGLVNGIEDHTVIRSNVSIEKGEKIMFMLDEVGQGDFFGTNYTAASTGVSTAEEQLDNEFKYETNEALSFEFSGVSDWNVNTNATHYFDNGAGVVGYRKGGASTVQGMFSLRFTEDGKLTIFSEDNQEKVATAKADPAIGSSVQLFFGVRGNRAYYSIPVVSKQSIVASSQPVTDYAPVVADQTVTVTEGDALNFQIVATDYIVTTWVETDAPAWMIMNQTTGVLSGTAPAFAGTAADTIVVNCKAGNSVGGVVSFTVTVTVAEAFSNTTSLQLDQSTQWLQGNPVNVTALERATNGDGAAWSLSMWVKPNSSTANQTLMVYGAGDDYAGGAITLKQQGGTSLILNYGTVYDSIILVVGNAWTINAWNHVLVTFDGGTTGSVPADSSDYYSRFTIAVDGVVQSSIGVATGGGFDGALSGANPSDNIFRFGRASNVHNNYSGSIINQMAIWNSDQSANLASIYNGGATQDLTSLSPSHYYEIGTSSTSIVDLIGSADLTGYNFSASDLVTDAP